MPLGARSRAQPEIRSAEAELEALSIERDAKGMSLFSTLVEAHGRYTVAQSAVARLRDDVLPKLARAEQAAERAYRAGAISYLEWAQLQSERTAARQQQLDVAIDAALQRRLARQLLRFERGEHVTQGRDREDARAALFGAIERIAHEKDHGVGERL